MIASGGDRSRSREIRIRPCVWKTKRRLIYNPSLSLSIHRSTNPRNNEARVNSIEERGGEENEKVENQLVKRGTLIKYGPKPFLLHFWYQRSPIVDIFIAVSLDRVFSPKNVFFQHNPTARFMKITLSYSSMFER